MSHDVKKFSLHFGFINENYDVTYFSKSQHEIP